MATTAKPKAATGAEPDIEIDQQSMVSDLIPKGTPASVSTTIKYDVKVTDEDVIDNDVDSDERENYNLDNILGKPDTLPDIDPNTLLGFTQALSHFTDRNDLLLNIVRIPDFWQDKFYEACKTPITFQPTPFYASSVFTDLIPMVQSMNNGSGGRFNINVVTMRGDEAGVFLTNFTIPNPVRVESPASNHSDSNSGSDLINAVQLMMQQQKEENIRRDEMMLQTLRQLQPQQDRFGQFAEKMMMMQMEKTINGNNSDPANDLTRAILTSEKVIDTITEGLGRAGKEEKQSLVERAMDNPAIVNGALNAVSNLTNGVLSIADNLARQKQAIPAANQTVDAPEYETINPQQPQQRQPQQPQQPPMEQGTQEDMIKEMLDELESDRPLDATNVFLTQTLPQKFPMQTQMIVTMCRANNDFDAVFDMIEKLIPPQIMERYEMPDPDNEGEFLFNELGLKVQGRLEEIYHLIRSQPQQ